LTVRRYDDETLLFTTNVTISTPNVLWSMTQVQTTAQNYTGEIIAQVELKSTTTQKRLTKTFRGFIYENKM